MNWRPIPGWEGFYEVSDSGRVRSVDRIVTMRNGVSRSKRGVLLSPGLDSGGYLSYALWRQGSQGCMMRAHVAVLAAFVGPRPAGAVVRHLNGDPTDNRIANLAYGTTSENQIDKVRHGRHQNANKTECAQGHPFDAANTIYNGTWRKCRTCISEWARRRYLRKKGTPEHRDAITGAEFELVIAALESRPDVAATA